MILSWPGRIINALRGKPDLLISLLLFLGPFATYAKELIQNVTMLSGDGLGYTTMRTFNAQVLKAGEFPFWNSFISGGVPNLADSQTAVLYPFSALALILGPAAFSNLYFLIHAGLFGIFSYMFLRTRLEGLLAPAVGGFALSFATIVSGFRKEHVNIYATIIWLPLVLWLIERLLATGRQRYLYFCAAAMSIQFLAGFPQIALYSDVAVLAYLVHGLARKGHGPLACIFAAGRLSFCYAGLIAIQLLPTLELMSESARAGTPFEFFSALSADWPLLASVIFPGIHGPDLYESLGTYSSTGFDVELYMGVLPFIYITYALRYHLKDSFVQICAAIATFAFLFMMCANLPYVGHVIHALPVFGSFRCQSRMVFIFVFFCLSLAAYSLSKALSPQSDTADSKRLVKHAFGMLAFFVVLTLSFCVGARSQLMGPGGRSYYGLASGLYTWPLALGALNLAVTWLLHTTRSGSQVRLAKDDWSPLARFATAGFAAMICVATFFDVGRFSFLHHSSNVDSILDSETFRSVSALPEIRQSRVMQIFASHGDQRNLESGFAIGANRFQRIKNIKGQLTFENRRLDRIMGQGSFWLQPASKQTISEQSELLSMLSVRYLLSPKDQTWETPRGIPRVQADVTPSDRLVAVPEVVIGGGQGLSVFQWGISLTRDQWVRVEFDSSAKSDDSKLFYIDLYGNVGYDESGQDAAIQLRGRASHYSLYIPTGDPTKASADTAVRIVCDALNPIILKNFSVWRVASLITNYNEPSYRKVSGSDLYDIYENTNAQPIVYIPDAVKPLASVEDLYLDRNSYPGLDRISYIEGHEDLVCTGSVRVASESYNGIVAAVTSQRGTFLTYSQSHYPGWRASIDGKPVPLHLVNGVIQGVDVPAGEHVIEFRFLPFSFIVGSIITGGTLALLSLLWIFTMRRRRLASPPTHSTITTT